jgi:predicted nucleic acid-binding protein
VTAGPTFVDTNVLVYAHNAAEPDKHATARTAVDRLWADRSGIVSTQVLSEFYDVMTRKAKPPMSPIEAREIVGLYGTWRVVESNVALILAAGALHESDSIAFWDALIVEAARLAGCTVLLTEDLQKGRTFGALEVVDPFAAS